MKYTLPRLGHSVSLEVHSVQHLPLPEGETVCICWVYLDEEGTTPSAKVDKAGTAVFEHVLTVCQRKAAQAKGPTGYPRFLQLCLQHVVPGKPARVLDKLALDLNPGDPFCGRLGITSAKALVFNIQFLEGTEGLLSHETSLLSSNGRTFSNEMTDLERQLAEAEHQLQNERRCAAELKNELERWKDAANTFSHHHRDSGESEGLAAKLGLKGDNDGDRNASHPSECSCVVS
eukprot:EG_transcript_16276